MACFPCSSTPQFPSVASSRSPPRPRFPRNAKNTQKRAHMGAFLMFFAFSDPAPSYPLNFPSNTTNTSIWTCLSCSRVPGSPTKNPLAEHIKHACIGVFYVFGTLPSHRPFYSLPLPVNNKNAPKLGAFLVFPYIFVKKTRITCPIRARYSCLHYFIPSNTKARPSGCSWSLKGENASSFNPEHRRTPGTAYFDVQLSSSPQPHHTTIQPISSMSLHFLSLPHLCHLLR